MGLHKRELSLPFTLRTHWPRIHSVCDPAVPFFWQHHVFGDLGFACILPLLSGDENCMEWTYLLVCSILNWRVGVLLRPLAHVVRNLVCTLSPLDVNSRVFLVQVYAEKKHVVMLNTGRQTNSKEKEKAKNGHCRI